MMTKNYKIKLSSDVVITANAATQGSHEALDYIPGSVFLGIAAAKEAVKAKKNGKDFPAELLLSGEIRFNDAFPFINGEITVPVPHSYHSIKGEEWKGTKPCGPDAMDGKQPVQWRGGYMTQSGVIIRPGMTFRQKTAIDRNSGKSSDGQMFGYQAIEAGSEYAFSIDFEDENKVVLADEWFTGDARIGRSRTAEYGKAEFQSIAEKKEIKVNLDTKEIMIYLLSDFALHRNGMPVLLPMAEDFGLPKSAELVKEKTFLRRRSYAPWNSFFHTRMQERQVLCKGGVIAFKCENWKQSEIKEKIKNGIGLYREEGLGRVTLNPNFLFESPELSEYSKPQKNDVKTEDPKTTLTTFLNNETEKKESADKAFKLGMEWAAEFKELSDKLKKDDAEIPGPTQWSNLREIAKQYAGDNEGLKTAIKEFGKNLRRKMWNESTVYFNKKEQSMLGYIESKSGDGLFSDALYHASVEMRNKLKRGDK